MKSKETVAGIIVQTNVRLRPDQISWLRRKSLAEVELAGTGQIDKSKVLRALLDAAMLRDGARPGPRPARARNRVKGSG